MPNVYARATPLPNVCGRVDYISNPKRQEHLVAVYSEVDKQFWVDLAAHCQKMAKEAGHEKACEGREWHGALPNIYAEIYRDHEIDLAKEISDTIKEITGTDNITAVHWNKTMTNLHFHSVSSENKEVNEISYGAVLTRNTYYNAEGKRSSKKECVDPEGNLLPGCRLYKKGERVETVKRFGAKEDLFNHEVTEKIKAALSEKFNLDLQTEQFQVYKEDGMHLKTQKVGKGIPEELKEKIEEKNRMVHTWNNTVDELLEVAAEHGEVAYNNQLKTIKNARDDMKTYRMTKHWLSAAKFHINQMREKINMFKEFFKNKLQECPESRSKDDRSVLSRIANAKKERAEKRPERVKKPNHDRGGR